MVTNLSCYCSIEHGSSWYGEEGDGENLLPTTVMVSFKSRVFSLGYLPWKIPRLVRACFSSKKPQTTNPKPQTQTKT